MSLIPPGIAVDLASELDLLNPVLFLQRNVAGFVADVTVEEAHTDRVTKTRHPVEQGAAITDHAFVEPSAVTIRAGWSNASPEADGNPSYITDTYNDFLALQASRQPFDIVTAKRSYSSMLITRLHTRTDERSAEVLMLEVDCEQAILVSTQTVQVPGSTVNRGSVAIRETSTFNAQSAGVQ